MTDLDRLLDYIFEGKKPALYYECEAWSAHSRRFRAFISNHRDKIRSKLRNVRDQAGLKDVGAELETAMLILREEQFTLEYETYAALKQRGPDFTVTYKTHTPFNVEVRRIRGAEMESDGLYAVGGKLMAILSDKVRQMPPSIVNLLWLKPDRQIPEAELVRAAATLRQMADDKAEEFFERRGFSSAADFIKRYQRLSGVVLRQPEEIELWLNPLARHPAPREIVNAIRRLGRLPS